MFSAPGKKKMVINKKNDVYAYCVIKRHNFWLAECTYKFCFLEGVSTTKAVSVSSNIHGNENKKRYKEKRKNKRKRRKNKISGKYLSLIAVRRVSSPLTSDMATCLLRRS